MFIVATLLIFTKYMYISCLNASSRVKKKIFKEILRSLYDEDGPSQHKILAPVYMQMAEKVLLSSKTLKYSKMFKPAQYFFTAQIKNFIFFKKRIEHIRNTLLFLWNITCFVKSTIY